MADKSKKDLAFDRERAKYKKQIKELESEISVKTKEISDLKIKLMEQELKTQEKEDHINRLLEYMDMSEEDYQRAINKDKVSDSMSNALDAMNILRSNFNFIF